MLECYVDDETRSSDPHGRIVCCTAYLIQEEERDRFSRHWRHLLMKHELTCLHLIEWRALARNRNWDGAKSSAVFSEFSRAIDGHDLLGFVVAMDMSVWDALESKRRKVFGSARDFCFLRLIRVVVDRLEAVGVPAPIAVVFDRDLDSPAQRASALQNLFKMDSRAATYVQSIRFSHTASDCYFQATEFLTCLARRQLADRPGANIRLPAWLRTLSELPAARGDMHFEFWDKAHADTFLASIEWNVPDRLSARPRRKS